MCGFTTPPVALELCIKGRAMPWAMCLCPFASTHLTEEPIKGLRYAYDRIDPNRLVNMTDEETDAITKSRNAIHARKRIDVVRQNARIYYALIDGVGSFRDYVSTITHIRVVLKITTEKILS